MKSLLLVVGLSVAAASPAFAATFDFSSLSSVSSTGYSQTNGGITVAVTAPGNQLAYYTVTSAAQGLGNSGCVFGICSAAIQQNETLTVTFSQSVTVTQITLGAWDGPDAASLVSTPGGTTMTLDGTPANGQFDLSALGTLTSFTIKDTQFTGLFTLRGLQVTPVAPVPVPAAAWLFGSSLLAFAGLGRKRQR